MVINSKKSQLIVIAGPTASGKTAFAIKLARKIGGELVNADSRQVYKFMDIGTNKGELKKLDGKQHLEVVKLSVQKTKLSNTSDTKSLKDKEIYPYDIEESGVIGWLFNIVKPDEEFNVSDYQVLALEVIKNINSRGKVAILVGGTGLYIDAVIKNYKIKDVPPNLQLRKELQGYSVEQLQRKLKRQDNALFTRLNNSEKSNPRRLIRMIEKTVCVNVGSESFSKTGFGRTNEKVGVDTKHEVGPKKNVEAALEHEFLYLDIPRAKLYDRINQRAEEMFAQGFVEEVENLIKKGYKSTKPMQGIGYREVLAYLDGEITMEECIEKTKQAHRNYAKRQITWFKKHS